jgi:hypothetical protein
MHECTFRFKLVHASQESAAWGRSPTLSYLSSTRSHGVSLRRFNILCCILISVVLGATLGAVPFAQVERQLLNNVPTRGTRLTGREEPVNNLFSFPISFAFIGEHVSEQTHTYVRYSSSKTVVSYHTTHVQVFDTDDVEPSHKVSGELVQIIRPTVADVFMQSSDFYTLPLPSSTTFLTPCENALQPRQLGEVTTKMFRICNAFTVRKSGQPVDAKVNPNALPGFWQFLNIFIEAESNKVFPGRFLDYRNRCGFALEFSTPMDIDTAKTRNIKVFVCSIPFEGTTGVFGGLPVSLLLEGRVPITFSPKVEKGSLQVTKRLLSGDAGHVTQPLCILLFLERSEQCRSIIVADSFLFRSPSFRPDVESPIVNVAAATENPGEFLGLSISRIKPKSVSCFHTISVLYVS